MKVLASILNVFRFNSRNWKALALCGFAATVFWFFNALNKNYTTTIAFPVEFEFDEEQYIPLRPLPSHVRINVTGMGWDLFRRSSGLKVPPLTVALERPSEIKRIVAVPALFAPQMERFQINFLLTDTLIVDLEPKVQRWVSLRLDPGSIRIKNNFVRTSEPVLRPDSIYVEGPSPYVKNFVEPIYLKLSDRDIDEDYREDVEVEFLHNEHIKRNPPTVSVEFSVDKLITITDSIPLSVVNYPKGANPYLGIKALPCTFAIPESKMSEYQPDSVNAVIDLTFFVRGTRKIKPEVTGLPPYSVVQKIDSIFVKF
jgi:hypothetical protein